MAGGREDGEAELTKEEAERRAKEAARRLLEFCPCFASAGGEA
ncbi:MAG TPA: hypothetical protein VEX11_11470 [Acetobacteraceae bacterium]|jgi:hypothetical protein|nr:hypothetical protein [Acetobacteraceae bacterium]